MAVLRSLGKLTCATTATRTRLTATQADPTARVAGNSVFVQQLAANTGFLYIGRSDMNVSTLDGVFGVVPPPQTGSLPFWSSAVVMAPAGIVLSELYLMTSVAGEGALVSYVEA